jgi:hypothetical protein
LNNSRAGLVYLTASTVPMPLVQPGRLHGMFVIR